MDHVGDNEYVADLEIGSWVRVKDDGSLYSLAELGFRRARLFRRWPRPEIEVFKDRSELTLIYWDDLGTFEKVLVSQLADPAATLRDEYFRKIFSQDRED